MLTNSLLIIGLLLLSHPGLVAQGTCDMIYFNGIIHTMDDDNTIATAMAVTRGKIVAIGPDKLITRKYHSRQLVDLKQQQVFPGFIDAHAHLFGIGEQALLLPLKQAGSRTRILEMIAQSVKSTPSGSWIRGRGWDQNTWVQKIFPNKSELDSISTLHPMFLVRVDGHAAWVNSAALAIAGISSATPDPPGGKILRDENGTPTGLLLDDAIELVRTKIPLPTPEQRESIYEAAIEICARNGITGMHDMGIHHEQIEAIQRLIARNRFPFRLTAYIDGRGDDWEALLKSGRRMVGDDQLTLNGLKLYADGALG